MFSALVNILTRLGFDVATSKFRDSLAQALWKAMEEEKKIQKASSDMQLGAPSISIFLCFASLFFQVTL